MKQALLAGISQQQNENTPASVPVVFEGNNFLELTTDINLVQGAKVEIHLKMENLTKLSTQGLPNYFGVIFGNLTFGNIQYEPISGTIQDLSNTTDNMRIDGVLTNNFTLSSNTRVISFDVGQSGLLLSRIGNGQAGGSSNYPDIGSPFQCFEGEIERLIIRHEITGAEVNHFVGDGVKLYDILSANEATPIATHVDLTSNEFIDCGSLIKIQAGQQFELLVSMAGGQSGIKTLFASDDGSIKLVRDSSVGALFGTNISNISVDNVIGSNLPDSDNVVHIVKGTFDVAGELNCIFSNSSRFDERIVQSTPVGFVSEFIFIDPSVPNRFFWAARKKNMQLTGLVQRSPFSLLASYEGVSSSQFMTVPFMPSPIAFLNNERFNIADQNIFVSDADEALEFGLYNNGTGGFEYLFTNPSNDAVYVGGTGELNLAAYYSNVDIFVNGVQTPIIGSTGVRRCLFDLNAAKTLFLQRVGNSFFGSNALTNTSIYYIKTYEKGNNGGFVIRDFWLSNSSDQLVNIGEGGVDTILNKEFS